METNDRYPLAEALAATAQRITSAQQRPQALPAVVVTVSATRPALESDALTASCVVLAAAAHPGVVAAWVELGLVRTSAARFTTTDPTVAAKALGWLAPGSIRLGTATTVHSLRDTSELDELLSVRSGVTPGRRLGMSRSGYVKVSRRGKTVMFDVVADNVPADLPLTLGEGVELTIYDARRVLAAIAAEVVVVDASAGLFASLCRLAHRAVVVSAHHGAPALAELTSAGTERAVTSAAAALDWLAKFDGVRPIACATVVADAAAVESAPPVAQASLRPVQASFAGAYAASPVGLVCVLAPGTGKTVAAAGALAARADSRLVLVAAPTSVLHQWEEELAAHHPAAHVTNAADSTKMFSALRSRRTGIRIVLASHDTVARAGESALTVDDFVVDEGEFLRNASKRTTAMWSWRRKARRGMVLTATPVQRSNTDIGRLVEFVFADRTMFDGWPLTEDGLSAGERLGRFCFGLDDRAEADLPSVARRVLVCRPNEVEAIRIAAANQCADDAQARYAVSLADTSCSARHRSTARLAAHQAWQNARSAGCDPLHGVGTADADARRKTPPGVRRSALMSLVADGATTLVFCDSAVLARELSAWLVARGVRAASLTGAQSAPQRTKIARAVGDDIDVVVCAQVARLGLNLQAASRVVHFDTPASAGQAAQREGRARRLGGEAVDVVFLTTVGALDLQTAHALATRTDAPDLAG